MKHTTNPYIRALIKWCLKKQPKMPMERRRVRAARMAFKIYLAHKTQGVKTTTKAFDDFAKVIESSAETFKTIVTELENLRLKYSHLGDSQFTTKTALETSNDASAGIETNRGE